jgi:hypothetical protein
MFFGTLDILVDPQGWGSPEEGGCVDIFNAGVIDAGCGALDVEPDGVMGVTTVRGTIDTTAYSYDPDLGFEEIGPSQIAIDIVVTGTGQIERSPHTNYGVGVCGLPPETRGAFVDAIPELQRDSTMTGTLTSVAAGAIDVATLPSLLVQAYGVSVGACV